MNLVKTNIVGHVTSNKLTHADYGFSFNQVHTFLHEDKENLIEPDTMIK